MKIFCKKNIFKFLFGLIFLFLVFINAKIILATQKDNLTGWAWSEDLGWISMNCYNDYNNDGNNEDHCAVSGPGYFDYGANGVKSLITGSVWSEYFGWGCFGSTCAGWGTGNSPDGSSPALAYDKNTGLVSGWANFPTIGADGWLKFLGNSVAMPGTYTSCLNCSGADCGLCFSNSLYSGSGNICNDCTTCAGAGSPVVYSCASCLACYQFGTGIDFEKNRLVGWAWNGNGDAKKNGQGWVKFHATLGPVSVLAPWLQTLYGDIYSKKNIGSLKTFNPPSGQFNATYLLSASGTITHFNQSEEPTANWTKPGFQEIEFPEQTKNYYNSLGNIDIDGILAGQYGKVKTIINQADIENVLAGKVYYKNGGLTIDSSKVFNNGLGTIRANGLVVVKGNLNITADVTYQSGTAPQLSALPSVGWLVIDDGSGTKGNIIISPAVKKLVGAFYSEGTISTGDDYLSPNFLEVSGLMIAKQFNLQRVNFDPITKTPSEKVIYDGRIIANTPPGFQDISRALPIWSDVAP